MADILKGLAGAGGSFIFAWAFPSAIALAVFHAVDLNRLGFDSILRISTLAPAEQALALGIAASGVGLVMNALSTPMYRLLEGYSLPNAIQVRMIDSERRRRKAIEAQTVAAEGVRLSLLQERLQRLPMNDAQTAPTRLGNALRSFETYAVDRYWLDSQMFWSELYAVVPDSLRKESEVARSSVDFFVAATYLSAILGALTCVTAFLVRSGPDLWILLLGAVCLALAPVWYRSAVGSTSYWASTVRALVNVGRVPLAAAFGLRLPATIEEERVMWALAVRFAYFGFDEGSAVELDEFRLAPTTESSATPGPGAQTASDVAKSLPNGSRRPEDPALPVVAREPR